MSINFPTTTLSRKPSFYILFTISVVFFLFCTVNVSAQAPAAESQSVQTEQLHPVRTLFNQVIAQMNGVVAFTAQAIDAVRLKPKRVDVDQGEALPVPLRDLAAPVPVRFPLVSPGAGTFIINAPLSVTQALVVTGNSRLATTTVVGPFFAGAMTGSSLVIENTITADTLSVRRVTETGSLNVEGVATMGQMVVNNTANINGALRVQGGITTDGSDIDLADGSLFASNVVNKIVAGSNVTVTGTRNAPIISFVPKPFDGVLRINGERGNVEFEAGKDIEINDLEIENTSDLDSVRSRGGCSSCIRDTDVSDILTISGGTINNTSIGLSSAAAAAFSEVTVGNALATSSAFTVLSTGTSTFGGTINLQSGCFAINGVCVGGLSTPTYLELADTPTAFVTGALQYTNASSTALTQSPTLVFVNKNLGIGTSTPSARLSVEGSSLLLGELTVINSTSSQFSGGLNVTDGCVSVDGVCLGGAAELGDLNDVTLATVSDGDILIYDGAAWSNISSSTLGFGDGTFLGLADTPETYLSESIPFVNATSSALTQSQNFVYDGSRLAVGTGNPVSTLTVAGDLSILGSAISRWYDVDSSNYVGFRAPTALGANMTWTLPEIDGGINEILITDGSGTLRFASVESVGGGSPDFIGLTDTPAIYTADRIAFMGTSSMLFSDKLVFDGVNFGIGVDTPLAPLSVQGNVRLQAVNEEVGFYYNANANNVGIGTQNASARLAVENGSIFQQGGRASSTYRPSQVGSLSLAANPNANDVQVVGNRAYVVSSANGDDFHILDISNPRAPVQIGSLNLPAAANGVFVAGNYAYVVSTVGGDDFHVIDISNPSVPVQVSSLNLPTTANDVFVQGRHAYVVTENVGDDFHVIDIATPSAPQIVGEMELPDSGTAVKVRGQYAYVTTRGADEDFHVIDISNPSMPSSVDSILLADAANDVFLKENFAYVVSNSSGNDFHIIDITNPTAVVEVGSLNLITSAIAVTVSGKYAYVTSAVTGNDLHVVDVSRPLAPVEVGGVDIAAGEGTGIAVVGRYAYLTTTSLGAEFHVVDLTGIEAQSGVMHSLQSGSMTVLGDTVLSGELSVAQGLRTGQAGIFNEGAIYAAGTESSYFLGNMSIGTTTASSELTVAGTIQATNLFSGGTTNLMADAQGNIILEASDMRLKENVVTLTGSLDKILNLRGVSYAWKDKVRFGDQREIGFLAQEVDEIVPEVVRKGGAYWSLNTKNLLGVVVEAMKEMWSVVQGNQRRIQELETLFRELEDKDGQPAASEEPKTPPTENTPTKPLDEENDTKEVVSDTTDQTANDSETDTLGDEAGEPEPELHKEVDSDTREPTETPPPDTATTNDPGADIPAAQTPQESTQEQEAEADTNESDPGSQSEEEPVDKNAT